MKTNQALRDATIVEELTNLINAGYMVSFAKGYGVIIASVADDGKHIAAAREATLFDALGEIHTQVPEREKSTIAIGSRVNWTSQSGSYTREKVGIVVGIAPASQDCIPKKVCDFSFVPQDQHSYHFEFYGKYVPRRSTVSYFVSVKVGKTDKAKRGLYRPRQVTLCEPDDKRDGVYR